MTSRKTKWLIGSVLTILALVAIGFIAKNRISRTIEASVRKSLSQSQNLHFDEMEMSIFPGKIRFTNITLEQPLAGDWQKWGKSVKLTAPELRAGGVRWFWLLFNHLSMDSLELRNPVMAYSEKEVAMPVKVAAKTSEHELRKILIKNVHLLNAKLQVLTSSDQMLVADSLNMQLSGFVFRQPKNKLPHATLKSANLSMSAFSVLRSPRDTLATSDTLHLAFTTGQFRQMKNTKPEVRLKTADFFVSGFTMFREPADTLAENKVLVAANTARFQLTDLLFGQHQDVAQPLTMSTGNLFLSKVTMPNMDGLHDLSLRHLSVSQKDSTGHLEDFAMTPRHSKAWVSRNLKKKCARLDFSIPEIKLSGWQIRRLFKGELAARSMKVEGMALDVFDDSNLPREIRCITPMPQEALQLAPFGIFLDSILLKNGGIHYENIALGKQGIGTVDFQPLSATIVNVTNDSLAIRRRPAMEIWARAKFQKKAWVSNYFNIDLSSRTYAFSFEGNAEPMAFSNFNAMLYPAMNLRFENGTISHLHFKVKADRQVARGKLELVYDDLDIAIENPEKKKKNKLFSELAEMFVIKKNNDPEDKDYEAGRIFYRRDASRSFFHFWWQAIQSGLLSNVLKDFGEKQLKKAPMKAARKNLR